MIPWPEMKNTGVQSVFEKYIHFYQLNVVPHSGIFTESDLSIYIWFSSEHEVRSSLTIHERSPVKNWKSMDIFLSMDYLSLNSC